MNLKFCVKLGKTPKKANAILVRVYEDQALTMKYVYEWFPRFREGKETVFVNPRSGRPVTSVSDKNIEEVKKLITKDRRLTLRMIVNDMQINRKSVGEIITQDLGMRKSVIVSRYIT